MSRANIGSFKTNCLGTNLKFLLVVVGVVLIFEGLPWFLSPGSAKKVLRQLLAIDDRTLRGLGLALMLSGLILVYLFRG
jgi:uncharacterized protein